MLVGYTSGKVFDDTGCAGPARMRDLCNGLHGILRAAGTEARIRPRPFFDLGDLRVQAELAADGPFPGGSPIARLPADRRKAWAGSPARLRNKGFVVIGPHHHGNCTAEPYRPEGFLLLVGTRA